MRIDNRFVTPFVVICSNKHHHHHQTIAIAQMPASPLSSSPYIFTLEQYISVFQVICNYVCIDMYVYVCMVM
jgi:hypothetical protein